MLGFVLLVAAWAADTHQKVNPVEKVTTLLEKLQGEIEAEGKAEAEAYDDYACFCKDQADDKQYAIEKFIQQENVLKGKIEDKTARKASLDQEIAEHNEEIQKLEGEAESAKAIRDDENAAYSDRTANLGKAIDQMERAIAALSASKDDMTDSKAQLTQFSATIKNSVALAGLLGLATNTYNLLAMLQQPDTSHAYSYHSNEVIGTLKSLLKNFKQKKIAVDNEERATNQEFEMTAGARRNQIKSLQKSAAEKSTASASLEEELNEHSTELQETEYSHNADSNFLADLTTKCEQKSKDFDERSSTRTNELTAISKAIELLKGDVSKMYGSNKLGLVAARRVASKTIVEEVAPKVQDNFAEDAAESQLDELETVSFLQKKPTGRAQVLGFLTDKATVLKSAAIATLLVKIRDSPSPFAKVKQMIQDLVARLVAEAEDEASQKAWCDEEMASTTADRDDAQLELEGLNALHTEKSALSDQLTDQINTLSQELADLQKALNEETVLREKEHAENILTLEESQAGLEAVSGAIDFLNEFYNPGAFIQKKQAPSNAAEGYERQVSANAGSDGQTVDDKAPAQLESSSKTDASKSIIGLMEVIKSDFENTLDKTQVDEDAADAAYQTFKSDTETDIADKTELKGTKEQERTDAGLAIEQAKADIKTQSEMLNNALEELLKLKPVCVDTGMSSEERVARREQEIASLKEALKILQNTEFSF